MWVGFGSYIALGLGIDIKLKNLTVGKSVGVRDAIIEKRHL